MKAQDITPWQEVEPLEQKQTIQQNSSVLTKVGILPYSTLEGESSGPFEQKNGGGIILNELRQSLQYMKNKSTQSNFYTQLAKTNNGVITQRMTKNQFRPSQSLFNLKKPNPLPRPLKSKSPSDSRSTPFIKSRMETLLKNYEMGLNNDKYIKQQSQQITPISTVTKTKLEKIEAKKNNIKFLYTPGMKKKLNPEERPKRSMKVHVLDYLLGRWP